MDISLISIIPIIGDGEEQLAVRITDGDNSILVDVDTIVSVYTWLTEKLGTEQESESEPDDYAELLEETPRRNGSSAVDVQDLVADGGSGPMRVLKSPRHPV